MGGIKCITPRNKTSSYHVHNPLRLKHTPSTAQMGKYGDVPIHVYKNPSKAGLKLILAREASLSKFKVACKIKAALHLDSLWLSFASVGIESIPGWGGFNHLVTELGSDFQVSDVVAIPFINLDPTNLSTVYTALLYAQRESSKYNRNYCMVTFDQPLFIKSVDIIASSPELSNIIPRLGRFHLLMSFMAATGFIMAGSGFEQLWWTIYGSDGVTHMFDGHSYSRTLRLHTLTAQAIVTILFETTGARDSIDEPALNQIWFEMTTEEIGVSDAMLKPEVLQLTNVLNQLYQTASC